MKKFLCVVLVLVLIVGIYAICVLKRSSDNIELTENGIIYEETEYVELELFPYKIVEPVKIGWIRTMYNRKCKLLANKATNPEVLSWISTYVKKDSPLLSTDIFTISISSFNFFNATLFVESTIYFEKKFDTPISFGQIVDNEAVDLGKYKVMGKDCAFFLSDYDNICFYCSVIKYDGFLYLQVQKPSQEDEYLVATYKIKDEYASLLMKYC